MKLRKSLYAITAIALSAVALTGCNKNKGDEPKVFSFTAALQSGKTTLETGDTDQVVVYTNGVDDQNRTYTYSSNIPDRAEVDAYSGAVTAGLQNGQVTITVKETTSNKTAKVVFSVATPADVASGGFNYAAAAGADAVAKRTEILGRLEKYAIDTHLTGITLFENGGYVKYNSRLDIPTNEYITGYGFGILSEGNITGELLNKQGQPTETNPRYKKYLHSAQTQNPNKMNAWNDTGSAVSDLVSYISGSYWGTKMNSTKDGYVWYPMLAADKVNGKENNRPIPVGEKNALGLYKTWKIYVKTGENSGLQYRYNGNLIGFEKRNVTLEDYKFVYKLMLTGANKLSRGAEMAGDKSYGIKGAQTYFNRTKDMTSQAQIDATWNEMTKTESGVQDPSKFEEQQLGIMIGHDVGGDYLQLELINEIDEFTAMYTLSSNLVSPMPEDFFKKLDKDSGGTVLAGVAKYGIGENIANTTLSLGAYYLESYDDITIVFTRNDDYFEVSDERYLIPGVKITTYKQASQDQLFQYYDTGMIDSCGLPISQIAEHSADPDVRVTKGDSTFKLNVNSCNQERWDSLFGLNGSVNQITNPSEAWTCKPWMSNDNFLQGLYWSINREEYAANRGVTPSINYFADAYLSDPENGISYNSTNEHKAAVAKYHTLREVDGEMVDNYGYDLSKAVNYFKLAVQQLVAKGDIKYGSASNPTEIHISINWMYQTDKVDYGNDIVTYFETAFNDPAVSQGRVKLVVDQPDPSTQWDDVYNKVMMKGQFDLAFGAISGNTYSPLNFLEVLKSDNSSGFTLNWGPDTSKVDENKPLVFDGKKWSFDALWEVADRGGVVENGAIVKTCKNYYLDGTYKTFTGAQTQTLRDGGLVDVNLEFVELDSVKIEVNKVQVYIVGGSNVDVSKYEYKDKKLSIEISKELADSLYEELNSIVNKNKNPGDEGYVEDALARSRYNTFYTIEIYYTLSIKKNNEWGTPSQQMVTMALAKEDQAK